MSILALWLKRGASGLSLLQRATSQLGGIAPYHYWDFTNNRALFASADVGAVTSTPGWSYTGTHSVGGLRYADKADGTLESFGTNLLLQSQTFDNAAWTKTRATVTADATAAPDGTTTADAFNEDNTNSVSHELIQGITKAASAITYTQSVYVKKGGRDWVCITNWDNSANGNRFWFNVNTGVIGSTATFGTPFTSTSYSIEAAGNGFWRCITTFTTNTATSLTTTYYSVSADLNTAPTTALNAVGLYIWGAQLEAGTTATTYIPTTTAAAGALRRTDKGVLIEGARANICLRSQDFSNAAWSVFGTGCTKVGASPVAAPDGTLTAYEVAMGSTGGAIGSAAAVFSSPTVAVTTNYTWSVYVRAASGTTTIRLSRTDSGSTDGTADLTINSTSWTRLTYSYTSGATGSGPNVAIRNNVAGNSGNIYLWGAQLEAASFPSSYIPTTTASATRNADVLTVSSPGVTYPLSLFAEFERVVDTAGSERMFTVSDGTTNNRFGAEVTAADVFGGYSTGGGVANGSAVTAGVLALATVYRGAVTLVSTTDMRACMGGGTVVQDGALTVPATPTTIHFGTQVSAANPTFGYLRRSAIINSGVTDAQIQAMTT